MESTYWQEVVKKLRDQSDRVWAAHILASGLFSGGFEGTNLEAALKFVPKQEIIVNTLLVYEDWDAAQPQCDEILKAFGEKAIPLLLEHLDHDIPNIRRGVLGVLFDISPARAKVIAANMGKVESNKDVQDIINWILQQGDNFNSLDVNAHTR